MLTLTVLKEASQSACQDSPPHSHLSSMLAVCEHCHMQCSALDPDRTRMPGGGGEHRAVVSGAAAHRHGGRAGRHQRRGRPAPAGAPAATGLHLDAANAIGAAHRGGHPDREAGSACAACQMLWSVELVHGGHWCDARPMLLRVIMLSQRLMRAGEAEPGKEVPRSRDAGRRQRRWRSRVQGHGVRSQCAPSSRMPAVLSICWASGGAIFTWFVMSSCHGCRAMRSWHSPHDTPLVRSQLCWLMCAEGMQSRQHRYGRWSPA